MMHGDDQSVFEHYSAGSKPKDLGDYERRIIVKNGRYLQGMKSYGPCWGWSAYNAWFDKWAKEDGLERTRKVARELGGRMVVFNPVTGDVG